MPLTVSQDLLMPRERQLATHGRGLVTSSGQELGILKNLVWVFLLEEGPGGRECKPSRGLGGVRMRPGDSGWSGEGRQRR